MQEPRRNKACLPAPTRLTATAPQPQASAAGGPAARLHDAGGSGGGVHVLKLPGLHALQDIGPVAGNAVHQVLFAIATLHLLLPWQLLTTAGARHLPKVPPTLCWPVTPWSS